MKKEYETPVVDVLVFETSEAVMGSDDCQAFDGPDDICPLHGETCTGDGVCWVETGICIPEYNLSGMI